MITDYLNSFVRLGIGKAFEPRLGDGRFTMLNKSEVRVCIGEQRYSCALELSSDFQITGWKYGRASQEPKTYFYGYNKRYIDENGVYDPLRAIDEYSKSVPGLRLRKEDVAALASTDNLVDSQEAFIYNMLVSWFKARIYKDMNGKDNKVNVKQSAYRDSHVGIGIKGNYQDRDVEITLGAPIDYEDDEITFNQRSAENYWSSPYVMRYTSTNLGQVSFYMIHVLGRSGQSGLACDIPIPGISMKDILLDPVGNVATNSFSEAAVPWSQPERLWLYIMDYVRLNRLEQAFAAALEMLGAIASQPMPSYQESALWHNMITTVNLSRFAPTRARIPSNLMGEGYIQDTNASDFVLEESRSPANFMTVSAVLNYTAWVGIYALFANYAEDCSNWRNAFCAMSDELAVLHSVDARAALISLVTGKELVTCFNANCYLTYDTSAMADITQLEVDQVFEIGYDPIVRFDAVPAYVSGSLIIGTVATSIKTLAHLRPEQDFAVDRYGSCDPASAAIISNTYRMFGHDVRLEHTMSGELYPVYANTADATVATFELLSRARDFDKIRVTDSIRRPGRSAELPGASLLHQMGKCTVRYLIPTIGVTAWKKRTMVHRPNTIITSRREAVVFRVSNMAEFSSSRFTVRNRGGIRHQDFHDVRVDPAPVRPIGTAALAPITALDLGVHEDPADAAE
jgi:hypothetical protein